MLGSGTTTLITSNDEMEGVMKTIKYLEDFGILLKGVVKEFKMKENNKKEDLLVC